MAINFCVDLLTECRSINEVRSKLQGYKMYFRKYRSPYKNDNNGPAIIAMYAFCKSYIEILHVNRHIVT